MAELPATTIEVIELIMSTLNIMSSCIEELSRKTMVSLCPFTFVLAACQLFTCMSEKNTSSEI